MSYKRRGPFKLKCKICGGPFTSVASQAKYCSDKCKKEVLARRGWRTEKLSEKKCKGCDENFMPRSIQQKFCCKKCQTATRTYRLLCNRLIKREYFLEKFYFTCQKCNKQFNPTELHIHHVKPLCEGGKDIEENLTVLCIGCHRKKHKL